MSQAVMCKLPEPNENRLKRYHTEKKTLSLYDADINSAQISTREIKPVLH